ncbi:MAG: alpha-glucosidase C-terminal domain-containing protein [Alkalibacterium sp.]|nr:alpha-glucosidase C-terminal domain-containing protein [Alkalibacterium sp.]
MPIIQEGSYKILNFQHPSIFAYLREHDGEKLLVLNHFYAEEDSIDIEELPKGDVSFLIGNSGERKLEKTFSIRDHMERRLYLIKSRYEKERKNGQLPIFPLFYFLL